MPQSKDPYTVKYAASKRGKIQVTVVDGEKAAKKFLADVKKKGMNGIITKGGHQKEEVEEAYKTPAEKKAERLAKIARASAAREKDQAKEKEKATAKHNKASAKSREAIKYRGNKDQFGRVREEEEIDEAKMGAIARKIKAGPSPYTIVAIVGKKVVDQDYAKVADQVPAIVSSLKKEHPKAKIGVEDRSGKMMHTEDIDVTEGGLSMIGRTKPSRELNTSRQEKPHLSGGSLKDKKRDAHKAERSKAKKQLKGFKNY